MTYTFRPAVRKDVPILVAFAGPGSSGKTWTSLQVGQALAGDKPLCVIDTDNKRALHYAEYFRFLHLPLPPEEHRPQNFIQALNDAVAAGAGAIVFDTISHEYAELLAWADQLANSGTKPPANWMPPKQAHAKMMTAFLRSPVPLVFAIRARKKIAMEKLPNGKTIVKDLGILPQCEANFMFEMTMSATFSPETPGRVRYDLPHKIQRQHQSIFPDGCLVGPDEARALKAWAAGGDLPQAQMASDEPILDIVVGPNLYRRRVAVWEAAWTKALANCPDEASVFALAEANVDQLRAAAEVDGMAAARVQATIQARLEEITLT